MSEANKRQIGGNHYKTEGVQHWDFAASRNYDYFQGAITKYLDRWREKNGIEDLEKAKHYLEKYIEVEKAKLDRLSAIPKVQKIVIPNQYSGQEHPFGFDLAKEI